MARISSFTIFVWTTLIIYTMLGGLFSTWAASGTIGIPTQYTTILPVGMLNTYTTIETHNITYNSGWTDYTPFIPLKAASWTPAGGGFPHGFLVERDVQFYGITYWRVNEPWFYWDNDTRADTNYVLDQDLAISEFELELNASRFRIDIGTNFAADVIIMPCLNTTGYVFPSADPADLMIDSIGNLTVTVTIGSNITNFNTFDLNIFTGAVVNVLSGFYTIGAPIYIAAILAGIWWILLAFGIAKLIIG